MTFHIDLLMLQTTTQLFIAGVYIYDVVHVSSWERENEGA